MGTHPIFESDFDCLTDRPRTYKKTRRMLDFFSIFTKGGLVLWYFQAECMKAELRDVINKLLHFAIINKNSGIYHHDQMNVEYEMDNEFELVFVVGYQNFLRISYVDKLLKEISLRFRDQYKNELENGFQGALAADFDGFARNFAEILNRVETEAKQAKPKKYVDTDKFKSTAYGGGLVEKQEWKELKEKKETKKQNTTPTIDDDEIERNKQKLMDKRRKKQPTSPKAESSTTKKTKAARKWDQGKVSKRDAAELDFSSSSGATLKSVTIDHETASLKNKCRDIRGLEVEEINLDDDDIPDEKGAKSTKSSSSVFGMFKGLISQKELTTESMQPILEQYRLHLISKNVASEIAIKIIENVRERLVGKTISTFASVKKAVFGGIEESLVQILTPTRRVDILRDVHHAKSQGRPYSITFCGVNGVGKSTNLAKIAFWLVENGFRIMIGACDTFRSGAIEQLRTHAHRINGIYPDRVQVFDQGYGKDATTIAMHAISGARDGGYDVVLIDTAGRMQDNEPLMRSLAKLIAHNRPDLVLFVGEALVGNDAVDQLTNFNRALANQSVSKSPRSIDGIVLSKFDTIDDKVGAAISMTYITGQPIVFIGTGQTFADLKSLNPRAVVNILLR